METVKKVYLELNERSITKILNGLKSLEENGVKYSILEESPYLLQDSQLKDLDASFYKKKLGKQGLMILQLLYEGLSYQKIAEKTDISIDGVRYYIKKIFSALNVNNSREAIRIYVTNIAEL